MIIFIQKYLRILHEIQYIHSVVLIRDVIVNIVNFMLRFPDEASCTAYLKEQSEQ